MKQLVQILIFFLLLSSTNLNAGTLVDGKWNPDGCGDHPGVPAVDTSNAYAYNSSVHNVVAWQEATKAFNECMVKEANADNALIIKSAKEEQQRSRAILEKINAEAAQLKQSAGEETE